MTVPFEATPEMVKAALDLAWEESDTHGDLVCRLWHAMAAVAPDQSAAARDVLAERRRQIEVEGWTPEHDDAHVRMVLFRAAKCYYLNALGCAYLITGNNKKPPVGWPWSAKWWKPKNPRRDLVRAGALLLAERDRIKRCVIAGAYLRQGGIEVDGLYHLVLTEIERIDRLSAPASEVTKP